MAGEEKSSAAGAAHTGTGGRVRALAHTYDDFAARPRYSSTTVNEGRGDKTRLRKIAVRQSGGFKLIYDAESGASELYDLRADPAESRNLAGSGRPEEQQLMSLAKRHEPGPLKGLDPSAPPRKDDEALTPEIREELKSLGYIH